MSRTVLFLANGIGDYIMSRPGLKALVELLEGDVHLLTGENSINFLLRDLKFSSIRTTNMLPQSSGYLFKFESEIEDLVGCDRFINCAPWSNPSVEYLARQLQAGEMYSFHGEFGRGIGGFGPRHYTD